VFFRITPQTNLPPHHARAQASILLTAPGQAPQASVLRAEPLEERVVPESWESHRCSRRVSGEGWQAAATSVREQARGRERLGAAADAERLRGTAKSVFLKLQSHRGKAQAAAVERHW
jgi:hypothetical protein